MPPVTLHILGSLSIGGAENLVLDLVRCALSKGAVCHVVYLHNSPPERIRQFAQTGVLLQQIQGGKGMGVTFRFIRELRNYLKKNKIEAIHCHNNVDAYWAAIASAGLKTPSGKPLRRLLSIHGFNLHFHYLKQKFPFKLLPSPDKQLLKNGVITFVSGETKRFYTQKYPDWEKLKSAAVVYNGIDFQKIDSATATLLFPPDKPVLGMVGSFNAPANLPEKRGQYLVCQAIRMLREQFEGELPFHFVFIGAPNSCWDETNPEPAGTDPYSLCRNFCREHALDGAISFLSPRTDIYSVLKGLSGYVYSSRVDTFGLSVIEAILCGLPVICSDVPTFREVTLEGKLAQLTPHTPEAFASAIRQFLETHQLPSTVFPVAERIRIARENYSIESCYTQLTAWAGEPMII